MKTEYYNRKMSEAENPKMFIVELERLKTRLEKKGFNISLADFKEDILAKLPESEDMRRMNPYQVQKEIIKERKETDEPTVTIQWIRNRLLKVYQDHYENKSSEKSEGEVGFFAGKAFKGRCHKCGKIVPK